MKASQVVTVAALICTIALAQHSASAEESEIRRTALQRHDLSVPGREVVQVLVEFAPGAEFPRHSHPGEEIVYIVEGALEYRLDGKPPVILKVGEVLFIAAGEVHAVMNVGSGHAAELATYIVDKEKPLLAIVK